MKYNLEDLLQKTYAQKEKPSEEFCQTVICGMKAKENATVFFGTGWRKYKIMVAAACIVLVLLVGATAKDGKKKAPDSRATFDQATVGTQTHAPTEPDFAKHTEQVPSDNSAQFPGDLSTDGGKATDTGKMQAAYPTVKPTGRARQIDATMPPAATSQPRVSVPPMVTPRPRETMPPANTPQSEETPYLANTKLVNDYVSFCSMETSAAYSYERIIPDGECIPVDFWGSMFYNRMIGSYEELQTLIQKAKAEADQQPDNAEFQNAVGQLGRYDRDYFATNVLCINLFFLDEGSELKLEKVCTQEKESGIWELNIRIQIIPGKSGEGEKKFYNCLVQVPKDIVQKCDSVNMNQDGY